MNQSAFTYRSSLELVQQLVKSLLLVSLLFCFSYTSMSYFIESDSESTELVDLELEDDLEIDSEDDLDDLFNVDWNLIGLYSNETENKRAFAYHFSTAQFEVSPSTPPPDFA